MVHSAAAGQGGDRTDDVAAQVGVGEVAADGTATFRSEGRRIERGVGFGGLGMSPAGGDRPGRSSPAGASTCSGSVTGSAASQGR